MDKQLIANELLPIYQTTDTGERVVDARELCGFLNIGRDFSTWMKERIEKYGFVEGADFSPVSGRTSENGGRPRTDYILKLDMAKELAMVENNEQGRKARRYFIEVEKRYHARVPLAQPTESTDFEQVNKLLQMIRMGERDHLFNEETDQALRKQVAKMVLKSGAVSEENPSLRPPEFIERKIALGSYKESTASTSGVSDDYTGRWYTTKEIAIIAGVTTNLIAKLSTKYNLRHDRYSRELRVNPERGTGLVQICYNEDGKSLLVRYAEHWLAEGNVLRGNPAIAKRKRPRRRR